MEQLPGIPLNEPTRRERLEAETEMFGYAVSGHPLELFADVAWDTYCLVSRLPEHVGETVVTCGLVIEQRRHHQITGEQNRTKRLMLLDKIEVVARTEIEPVFRSGVVAGFLAP